MTGPEHYREAERLLASTLKTEAETGERYYSRLAPEAIAAAQVHATLALAAASAMPTVERYTGGLELITEWGRVLGRATAREANEVPFR